MLREGDIQAALQKVKRGTKAVVTLSDPAPRGSGRLVLLVKPGAWLDAVDAGVTSEDLPPGTRRAASPNGSLPVHVNVIGDRSAFVMPAMWSTVFVAAQPKQTY